MTTEPERRGRGEARQVARNTASSYAIRALLALSALLLTPYLFRNLGTAGFGTWSVMFTVATVFNLLEVGFDGGIAKFVAELRGAERDADARRTVGVAVVLMTGLGMVAALTSTVLALLADGLAPAAERADFRAGMVVLGAAMLVRFPAAAYGGALMGYQRWDLLNGARAVQIGGFPIAAVVVVEAGGGVLGLAVAFSVLLVAEALLYAVLVHRLHRGVSLAPRLGTRAERRGLGGFASLALLADSMTFVGQRMDTLVIAAVRNAATAAPFAAAVKLQSGVQSLTLPFVDLLMPMVSELEAGGRRAELTRRLILATRVVLQVTLPVAVALALFADDLVDVWLGTGAPEVTVSIVVVLMVVQIVTLTAAPSEKVLVGLGRVRMVAGLATVEGLANLGLSIALISAHGAIGAALGTAFTSAVLAPLRLPLACRAAGCQIATMLRAGVVPALASSAPGVAAMVVTALAMPSGLARLVLGTLVGVGISGAIGLAQVGAPRLVATVRGAREAAGTGGI